MRLAYTAIFGLGSIIAMALLSAAIAVPLRLTSRYPNQAHGALGGVMVYRVEIIDGFFGS